MIATSCEDKNIRIFYIAASTDQPLKIFKGKSRSLHYIWITLLNIVMTKPCWFYMLQVYFAGSAGSATTGLIW